MLALTGLLVLSAGQIGHSQSSKTPAPNSRAEAELLIKQYAERHVDSELSMQTSNVVKYVETHPAQLSSLEISTIYEKEYARLKKAKDENFWEQVRPQTGWIVAGLIFLWALTQKKLKAWFDAGIGKLEQAIYERFSGSKLFWNKALQRYRKALVEKHGELKIPFRPNRPLQMAEIYVPLKVAGSRSSETKVEALQAVRQFKRLMVKGEPGSGKTMLLRYLALNYGLKKRQLMDEPVVVLLELHRLAGGAEILPQLVEALKREDFPNGEAFLKQALKSGRLVLLLDGLDEVSGTDRAIVVQRIRDFLDEHGKCCAVLTCRTQVYRGEFDQVVDQTLEVVEFSDSQIQAFLVVR